MRTSLIVVCNVFALDAGAKQRHKPWTRIRFLRFDSENRRARALHLFIAFFTGRYKGLLGFRLTRNINSLLRVLLVSETPFKATLPSQLFQSQTFLVGFCVEFTIVRSCFYLYVFPYLLPDFRFLCFILFCKSLTCAHKNSMYFVKRK